MKSTLKMALWLPKPLEEVFAFFSDAGNLEAITPDSLRFQVLTPRPIEMRRGALIDYKLKVHGFPMRWQSEITVWEPPFRFVDEQRRGPYRVWIHEHSFQEQNQGTLVSDKVEYEAPGGRWVDRFFVRPDLERIFRFRKTKLLEIFARPPFNV